MAYVLEKLYKELKEIRTYLIKIGPTRRQGSVLDKKLSETNDIFRQYDSWLLDLDKEINKNKIQANDIPLIKNSCKNFEALHKEVLGLCQVVVSEISINMDIFNLKTALSLLPVMSDEESSVRQLIDNIQYYDSLLKKVECKQSLINFVLKSRLSQVAKLKLKTEYANIRELVADMNSELLPKKNASAIQNKLNRVKQNELTISDYGKEVTKLFVDLTISQANGNSDCFNILKPINEKYAIKQFSDGLRNRRLSTIIAARNYSALKDAIQAAQEEEICTASTSGEIMGMSNNQFYNSRNYRNYRGSRGGFNKRWPTDGESNAGYSGNQRRGWNNQTGFRGQRSRGRQNRGTYYNYNRGNRGIRNHNVHTMNESDNSSSKPEERLDTFFRDEP